MIGWQSVHVTASKRKAQLQITISINIKLHKINLLSLSKYVIAVAVKNSSELCKRISIEASNKLSFNLPRESVLQLHCMNPCFYVYCVMDLSNVIGWQENPQRYKFTGCTNQNSSI